MFSKLVDRLPGETNSLYRIHHALQSRGTEIRNLVSGLPEDSKLQFPPALFERMVIKACRATASYKPDPRGQRGARDSIATYYREAGISFLPENVLLTPGTSTAYQYCFQTVANRGDEILCPQPSYPLFEYIAELCGVRMVPYRHVEARGWAIDLDFLEASVSTATRAIVLISPHNPTGYVAHRLELRQIAEIARRHDLAIVSDEVFSEFIFDGNGLPRIAAQDAPLVFTLNGFSKMFALPGIKLSWMGLTGDDERVEKAMGCLELISDTYLSVSEIAQALTPRLFREGRQFLMEYQREIGKRRSLALGILRNCSRLHFVEPAAGFFLTLRLDGSEDNAAETLLKKEHMLVHPGHFYDLEPDHLILSFVQEPSRLQQALTQLVATVDGLS